MLSFPLFRARTMPKLLQQSNVMPLYPALSKLFDLQSTFVTSSSTKIIKPIPLNNFILIILDWIAKMILLEGGWPTPHQTLGGGGRNRLGGGGVLPGPALITRVSGRVLGYSWEFQKNDTDNSWEFPEIRIHSRILGIYPYPPRWPLVGPYPLA